MDTKEAAVGAAAVQPTVVPSTVVSVPVAEAIETAIIVQLPKLTPSQKDEAWDTIIQNGLGNLHSEDFALVRDSLRTIVGDDEYVRLLTRMSKLGYIESVAYEFADDWDNPSAGIKYYRSWLERIAVSAVYILPDGSVIQVTEDDIRECSVTEAAKVSA